MHGGAEDIDSILDTLSKYKIHITFFVVGDFVQKHPEAVKKMAAAGHNTVIIRMNILTLINYL